MKSFFMRFISLSMLVFLPKIVCGITPMDYYNSLVAGRDDAGFRDGDFSQALFDHPCGLAIDDSGSRLFVADSNNNRIRVIYLNEDNQVKTLAGTDKPGKTDGKFSEALFNQPTLIAYLPNDQLAVYDGGDHLLRLIDIKSETVSTLAGNSSETILGNVWSLSYNPQDNSLYFSEPYDRRLRKWNLKLQKLETVLSNNTQVPMPRAICVSGNKLYAADLNLPDIYQVETSANTTAAIAKITKVGTCDHVHELAGSDGIVYAEQEGTNALVRILPDNQPVSLRTAWGFLAENNDPGVEPLWDFERTGPSTGFVVSPKENRKLFITSPDANQSIISIKDYDFGKWMGFQNYDDFDYPDEKPDGTFRILVVGDSRVGGAMSPVPPNKLQDPNFDVNKWYQENTDFSIGRKNNFSKQLELLLNANAAVTGMKKHFEVLTLCVPGAPSATLVNGPGLDLVKKKNVDLVIALAGNLTYKNYFGEPLTAEGLPGGFDPEWALKPADSRISSGVPRHLFDLCLQKKIVATKNDQFLWFIDLSKWNNLDPGMRSDLIDLTARPFIVFQKKLQSMITSGQNPKKLLILYIPWRYGAGDCYEKIWTDTCSAEHLNLIDLSEPFYAMKTSFYPTIQRNLSKHYLLYGDTLIAFLLNHYLTEQKWVPSDSEK